MTAPSRYLRTVRVPGFGTQSSPCERGGARRALRAEQAETRGDEARVQVCIDGFTVEAL